MPDLQAFSLQTTARINTFSTLLINRQQNLHIAFTLSGPDAHFYGRDLEFILSDWQIQTPEELHLKLLDLNKDCRLKKIQLNFALSLSLEQSLILACQGGKILLQRQGQLKELLQSQNELGMLVGRAQNDDQLLLLAGSDPFLGNDLLKETKNWLKNRLEKELTSTWQKNELGIIAIIHFKAKEKVNITTELKKQSRNIFKIIQKILKKIQRTSQKIKNLSSMSKKRYLKMLIVVALLLLLSLTALLYWQGQKKRQLELLEQNIQGIVLSKEELSSLSAQQPVLAREKVSQSQTTLEDLLKGHKALASKKLIQNALDQVEQQLQTLEIENNLDRLLVYANWRDSFPDFLGQKLLSTPEGVLVGDDQKQGFLLIKDQSEPEFFALAWQDFTLDLSQSDSLKIIYKQAGLNELTWNSKSIVELKSEGDSDREATLMTSYQNYIYLFNPEKRNIYRYTQNRDGLSEAIGWLIDKQGLSFAQVSDISVDGDLWLTFKTGEVKKFSRGYSESFVWSGLNSLPSSNLLISTKENVDKIIFLDKDAKRLLVSTKDGQLISEIKSNELAGVSDIDLASDGQSCFALSGSVIYQIQL